MAEGEQEKKCVLLAVDGGPHAKYALEYYLDNLHHKDDQLVLVHSLEPFVPTTQYVSGDVWMAMMDREREKMKDIERECEEQLKGKGISWRFKGLMGGRPGEMICDMAGELHAKLIVVGTRGLGSVRRTILGSVSDYILHHAHCPVCICRQ